MPDSRLKGARYGPSIMPGGNPAVRQLTRFFWGRSRGFLCRPDYNVQMLIVLAIRCYTRFTSLQAWPHVKEIFQAISAKVDDEPCCDWVGESGAGHYVKMVHNGIEYGDMQIICEAYMLMKNALGMSCDEMSKAFGEWNKGELDSFLIEITTNILAYKDTDGEPLVEKIMDRAGQKGTGKWTAISSLDLGMPVTLIGEAVFARCLSALQPERQIAAERLAGPEQTMYDGDKAAFVEDIRQALYASKIVSYAQGFMLLREAAKHYGWKLNYPSIALMWRGGCIIRSRFLANIKEAYEKNPDLDNLYVANSALVPTNCDLCHCATSPCFVVFCFLLAASRLRADWCSQSDTHTSAGFLTTFSPTRFRRRRSRGARWSRPQRSSVSRSRPLPPPSRSTTATALPGFPPTCSRHSAITSARTPTSSSTPRASGSTPTGPARVARSPARLTTRNAPPHP